MPNNAFCGKGGREAPGVEAILGAMEDSTMMSNAGVHLNTLIGNRQSPISSKPNSCEIFLRLELEKDMLVISYFDGIRSFQHEDIRSPSAPWKNLPTSGKFSKVAKVVVSSSEKIMPGLPLNPEAVPNAEEELTPAKLFL